VLILLFIISGLWAGIQLNEAVGKNNGSVAGVRYFKCPSDYGIFAPLSKISRPGILHQAQSRGSIGSVSGGITRNISSVKINVDHVTAKINTGVHFYIHISMFIFIFILLSIAFNSLFNLRTVFVSAGYTYLQLVNDEL